MENIVIPKNWIIPPAVFDYLTNLKGHIGAVLSLKNIVDKIITQMSARTNGGYEKNEIQHFQNCISEIRSHLEEQIRRFQLDFTEPEEPSLEEAMEMVRRGIKQYPNLDSIELAWMLRLTPTITKKAMNRLKMKEKAGDKSVVR